METKTLPSGAVLNMTMADFADGHRLMKTVAKELENVGFTAVDVTKDINAIKNIIMRLIYSESIEQALKPCLAKCNYNKRQITDELFEDAKVRGDYLPVVKEVLIFNITPFFASIGSLLKDIREAAAGQASP